MHSNERCTDRIFICWLRKYFDFRKLYFTYSNKTILFCSAFKYESHKTIIFRKCLLIRLDIKCKLWNEKLFIFIFHQLQTIKMSNSCCSCYSCYSCYCQHLCDSLSLLDWWSDTNAHVRQNNPSVGECCNLLLKFNAFYQQFGHHSILSTENHRTV